MSQGQARSCSRVAPARPRVSPSVRARRPITATRHPARASFRATACPTPLPAPVTTAVLFMGVLCRKAVAGGKQLHGDILRDKGTRFGLHLGREGRVQSRGERADRFRADRPRGGPHRGNIKASPFMKSTQLPIVLSVQTVLLALFIPLASGQSTSFTYQG